MLVEGRASGHEPEAEVIVDHHEPSRCEHHPLAIDAAHIIVFGRWLVSKAGTRGDRIGFLVHLPRATNWRSSQVVGRCDLFAQRKMGAGRKREPFMTLVVLPASHLDDRAGPLTRIVALCRTEVQDF